MKPRKDVAMIVVRAAARALTGSVYISAGYDAARSPGIRVTMAEPMLSKIRTVVPIPVGDERVVRANGVAQLLAGTALTLGVLPRLSAVVLAASLLPTTLSGHSFWAIEDPDARAMQRVQFLKNSAMLGGLMFATID